MTSSTGPPTVDDRTKWRSVPIAERIALAQKLIVLHPRFRDAVALLERCHQSFAQPGEPACGALLGTSGVGKTSVVDHSNTMVQVANITVRIALVKKVFAIEEGK